MRQMYEEPWKREEPLAASHELHSLGMKKNEVIIIDHTDYKGNWWFTQNTHDQVRGDNKWERGENKQDDNSLIMQSPTLITSTPSSSWRDKWQTRQEIRTTSNHWFFLKESSCKREWGRSSQSWEGRHVSTYFWEFQGMLLECKEVTSLTSEVL